MQLLNVDEPSNGGTRSTDTKDRPCSRVTDKEKAKEKEKEGEREKKERERERMKERKKTKRKKQNNSNNNNNIHIQWRKIVGKFMFHSNPIDDENDNDVDSFIFNAMTTDAPVYPFKDPLSFPESEFPVCSWKELEAEERGTLQLEKALQWEEARIEWAEFHREWAECHPPQSKRPEGVEIQQRGQSHLLEKALQLEETGDQPAEELPFKWAEFYDQQPWVEPQSKQWVKRYCKVWEEPLALGRSSRRESMPHRCTEEGESVEAMRGQFSRVSEIERVLTKRSSLLGRLMKIAQLQRETKENEMQALNRQATRTKLQSASSRQGTNLSQRLVGEAGKEGKCGTKNSGLPWEANCTEMEENCNKSSSRCKDGKCSCTSSCSCNVQSNTESVKKNLQVQDAHQLPDISPNQDAQKLSIVQLMQNLHMQQNPHLPQSVTELQKGLNSVQKASSSIPDSDVQQQACTQGGAYQPQEDADAQVGAQPEIGACQPENGNQLGACQQQDSPDERDACVQQSTETQQTSDGVQSDVQSDMQPEVQSDMQHNVQPKRETCPRGVNRQKSEQQQHSAYSWQDTYLKRSVVLQWGSSPQARTRQKSKPDAPLRPLSGNQYTIKPSLNLSMGRESSQLLSALGATVCPNSSHSKCHKGSALKTDTSVMQTLQAFCGIASLAGKGNPVQKPLRTRHRTRRQHSQNMKASALSLKKYATLA
uniref:Uncharacterized protein n=1 Tax=Octopus bimaculoides TaxID=37653 RepID=A0A0L8G4M9_OCTBM